jgi:hypothetical protein
MRGEKFPRFACMPPDGKVATDTGKRTSNGSTFVTNYTRSRSLDDQPADQQFSLPSPNPYSRSFNYSLSDFDTPNKFSGYSLWDLPKSNISPEWGSIALTLCRALCLTALPASRRLR